MIYSRDTPFWSGTLDIHLDTSQSSVYETTANVCSKSKTCEHLVTSTSGTFCKRLLQRRNTNRPVSHLSFLITYPGVKNQNQLSQDNLLFIFFLLLGVVLEDLHYIQAIKKTNKQTNLMIQRSVTKKSLEHTVRPLEFVCLFVCWLLNVPATCECISGTDLHRQLYMLPHWDRSCRSNFLPHPVTVYWHRADQSQCWPYNARRLAG